MAEVAWYTDNYSQYASVIESNRYMLENEVAYDITFKVSKANGHDAEMVRAHRYMLIARNPVFKAMFHGAMAERGDFIAVHDVSAGALRKIIKYLYCEVIEISEEDVFDILYAGNKYLIDPVIRECFKFLDANLTTESICPILNCALFYDDENLVNKCIWKVGLNTKEVIDSETFGDLNREAIRRIIKSKILNVSEDKLFAACIRWCEAESQRLDEVYSPQCIKTYLGDSFYHLRLRNLSDDVTRSILFGCGIFTAEEEAQLELYWTWSKEGHVDDDEPLLLQQFVGDKRFQITPGEVRCDVVSRHSGGVNTYNQPRSHTFITSEDIQLHGVDIIDMPQSCVNGVHLAVIQDSKTLFQTLVKVSAARRDTPFGHSIPVNLPKQIGLHTGEFSIRLVFKSLGGSTASVGCGVPCHEAIYANGVKFHAKSCDSFHISSLLFSVI